MVRNCLELPHSGVKHFPAGTYDAQMATETGRLETDVMRIVHQAWYTFQHLEARKWGVPERRFVMWMNEKPKPEPTRRLDELLAQLWGVSWWVFRMWKGRGG